MYFYINFPKYVFIELPCRILVQTFVFSGACRTIAFAVTMFVAIIAIKANFAYRFTRVLSKNDKRIFGNPFRNRAILYKGYFYFMERESFVTSAVFSA